MNIIHRCAATLARKEAPARQEPERASYFAADAHERCSKLFPRQRDVLQLLSKGLDQGEIAAAMGISVHTVREHKQIVFRVLEVNSAVEAAVLAAKAGLV